MNINGYLQRFGGWSLLEIPFNYVDALILAELAYVNMHLLMPKGKSRYTLSHIKEELLDNDDLYVGSVDAKYNKIMLKLMYRSYRFKDIIISDIVNKKSISDINQFYAFMIHLPTKVMYIAYRGTDTSLIGWKEDFLMSYQANVLAQRQASEYLKTILEKHHHMRFYTGGHSKGGNLAFYSVLTMDLIHNDRLIESFSFDGPGFKDGLEQFRNYYYVKNRLTKFRTYRDFVGNFFNNFKITKVVISNGILMGGHDPFFWLINPETGDFYYRKDVKRSAIKTNNKIMNWIESLTDADRALTVDAFFSGIEAYETIYDVLKNIRRLIRNFKKSLTRYSPEDRTRLKAIAKRLVKFLITTDNIKVLPHRGAVRLQNKIEKKNESDSSIDK